MTRNKSRPWPLLLTAFCLVLCISRGVSAREIHVMKTGNDDAAGDQVQPYLTISKAAAMAQPGDAVTVHAGTYREWVRPDQGGTGEETRITYRAAEGEEVLIKGSERITSWTSEGDGVWKVVLPNEFFGEYNPYALNLSGEWLYYGNWHHCGDVYLDSQALREQETSEAVKNLEGTWHADVDEAATTIRANFSQADPNEQLAEINVRESVFFPERSGLKYITVDGFHMMHSAENWQPPTLQTQIGTIGPRMGKHWVIQNCTITNARCVGIVLGCSLEVAKDIEAFGDHIIRNNVIRRCGQAGIAGRSGATRCLIEGNLIEDINYREEFGGFETAAIKFHLSVDTEIRRNLIRRVGHQSHGAFGIWIDFGNQGTRISRNIIYDTKTASVFLEMNHGAILVDNNVLIGHGVKSNSEGSVFAHNLFVDCNFEILADPENRKSPYYKPHTLEALGSRDGTPQNDKWYSNLFIRAGLHDLNYAPGHVSNHNVFLEGARKSSFGDEQSVTDEFETGFNRKDDPHGVSITFSIPDTALRVKGPQVDATLVGVFPGIEQSIEDRHGNPISVDTDLHGRQRTQSVVGPLAGLREGQNTIVWSFQSSDPLVRE